MLGIRKLLSSSISRSTPSDGLYVDASLFGDNSAIYTPGDPTRIDPGYQSYYPWQTNGGLSFWVKLSLNTDSSGTVKFSVYSDSRKHAGSPNIAHFDIKIFGIPSNGKTDNLRFTVINDGAAGVPSNSVAYLWEVNNWQEGWNHIAFQYLGRPTENRTNQMRAWINGINPKGVLVTNTGRDVNTNQAGISSIFGTYGNFTEHALAQSIYFNHEDNVTFGGEPNLQKSCFQQFFFIGGYGTGNIFDIDQVQRNGHFVNLGQNGTNGVSKTLVPEIYEIFKYPFTSLRETNGSLTLVNSSTNNYNCNTQNP